MSHAESPQSIWMIKRKTAKSSEFVDLAMFTRVNSYPEPESNRHIFRYWCLRPTRLPIPPSGSKSEGKGTNFFLNKQIFAKLFAILN